MQVLSAQYAICIVFHLDKMVLSISHTHTQPLTHSTIGTHLSISINFNVHTHTRSHALTHARESRNKCQHRQPSAWSGEREWQGREEGGR